MKENRFQSSKKLSFKVLLCLTLLAFCQQSTIAQGWMDKFGYLKNYFQIRDSTELWFMSDTNRRLEIVNDFKGFQRWKCFMESRIDANGSLSTYSIEYSKAVEDIKNRDLSNRLGSEWTPVGPSTNSGNIPYLGIVTSLKVVNKNTIYAGGGTGGLFITNDGGVNWRCLTDDEGLTGIESIEVNPRKPGTIYIGTGFFHGAENIVEEL